MELWKILGVLGSCCLTKDTLTLKFCDAKCYLFLPWYEYVNIKNIYHWINKKNRYINCWTKYATNQLPNQPNVSSELWWGLQVESMMHCVRWKGSTKCKEILHNNPSLVPQTTCLKCGFNIWQCIPTPPLKKKKILDKTLHLPIFCLGDSPQNRGFPILGWQPVCWNLAPVRCLFWSALNGYRLYLGDCPLRFHRWPLLDHWVIPLPETNSKRFWKSGGWKMIPSLIGGKRPIFRGKLLIWGSVTPRKGFLGRRQICHDIQL